MGLVINGQRYEKLGNFTERKWTNKFLGFPVLSNGTALFNLSSTETDPQIKLSVEKNIQKLGGDAAIDVKIRYGSNPLQWTLSTITLGIWMPGTIIVTGTVVKAVY